MNQPENSSRPGRRDFLVKSAAIGMGAVAAGVPALAGFRVIFDPVKRPSAGPGGPLLVTRLTSLPADGVPRRFQVLSDRVDAWNVYKNIPVGAVYLRRAADNKLTAFNAACPHAGCSVGFSGEKGHFVCPCHDSVFAMDGTILGVSSPSPRALDALEVEVRNDTEVWVKFRNYQPGHKEQIPVT